jgi:GH25 family lysozyme M1 (1,4-beta-N-acetylmuramidase)
LAASVQKALALSGLGSEAEADNEIKNLIEEHVQNQLIEDMENEETQKTNLEETVESDKKQKVSTFLTPLDAQLNFILSCKINYIHKKNWSLITNFI